MIERLYDFLIEKGFAVATSQALANFTGIVLISLLALVAYFLAKQVVLRVVKRAMRRIKGHLTELIFEYKVIDRLLIIVPALVIYYMSNMLIRGAEFAQRLSYALTVLACILALANLVDVIDNYYKRTDLAKSKPIKGLLQVIKIILYVVGLITIISVLVDKSPLLLIGGLGAASAVLILIFQNTILGLVASIQLTENDMVAIGDQIEMETYGVEGEVLEIGLHTVKVENMDKSVSTIPPYKMVTDSFKNWRNMQEKGVRLLKKSISIDLDSIGSEDDIRKFREYMEAYLREQPKVNKDLAIIVRSQGVSPEGLTLEVFAYFYAKTWAEFEEIQSAILEHMLVKLKDYGLRAYQYKGKHEMGN